MITRGDLQAYLNDFLAVEQFRDYAPNGLQVEGRQRIERVVTGVTASKALIEQAIEYQADALLVHHGYFWKGENATITGLKQQRIRLLLAHGINLFAYHLPLDAHTEVGNNAQLANLWGLTRTAVHQPGPDAPMILFEGAWDKPRDAKACCALLAKTLAREPLHLAGKAPQIQRIAWCSGAAQSFFEAAIALGVDAYISGEVSEPTYHLAGESGVHYFAAGHHATERLGVQALGEHLAHTFALQHQFVDVSNPV